MSFIVKFKLFCLVITVLTFRQVGVKIATFYV